jgi:hypothetical protein
MDSLYISGAAFLLTCRWANRATHRSIPFTAASRRCRAGSASYWMRERHGEGPEDDDGAPPQSGSPMPLLAADRQHQRVDAIGVGTEQAYSDRAHEQNGLLLSSTLRKSGGVLFPRRNAQAGKHAASSKRSASGAGIFTMSRHRSEA